MTAIFSPKDDLRHRAPDGGRMLIPVGTRTVQRLVLVERRDDAYQQREVTECTFVPLLGRFGWADGDSR